MGLTNEERQHIVEVAETWYGTPYRGWTCLKGIGCDCVQLLKGVFMEAGYEADGIPIREDYPLYFAKHKKSTEYVDGILKYMREIPESEVLPADVVAYQIGKGFTHAAIIKTWPDFVIHALEDYGVAGGHGIKFKFGRLEKKFFTLKEEFCKTKVEEVK